MLPIGTIPYTLRPVTNIVPFSEQDGSRYLEILYDLKRFVNDDIISSVNTEMGALADSWKASVIELVSAVEAQLEAQNGQVSADVAEMIDYVDQAVQSIVNSSINVQDPVVEAILGNLNSASRELLNTLYAGKAVEDTLNTGRLSDAQIMAAAPSINVARYYNVVGDGMERYDVGTITANSKTLNVSTALFSAADVGKSITVFGAGLAGIAHTTTIQAYASPTNVTLTTAAPVTAAGVRVCWGTDNTSAIRNALNGATLGKTLFFPSTGPGNFYLITDTIVLAGNQIGVRLAGNPRDGYNTSIRCYVTGKTMFIAKITGFVMDDIALIGDGLIPNGTGATVTGIELWGNNNGDIDCAIRGATFQQLKLDIRTRGRNASITDCLLSNSLEAISIDGPDAIYHTGPGREDIRGHVIAGNRFHTIGADLTQAVIRITPESKTNGMIIRDNFFDAGGYASHVVSVGSGPNGVAAIRGLSIKDNVHHGFYNRVYDLTNTIYTWVDEPNMIGASSGGFSQEAIVLTNCTRTKIKGASGNVIGKSAIKLRGSSLITISSADFDSVGMDTASGVYDFLDIDSSNDQIAIDNFKGNIGPGWGITGDPTNSSMSNNVFVGATLGAINSTTLVNSVTRGRNTFVEDKFGRLEDVAFKTYDFAAGVAKPIATLAFGGSNSSAIVEIEITAQNGTPANAHIRAMRFINPNNGVPTVTVLGADAGSGITLTVTTVNATTVTISATVSGTTFGSARIRTGAAGASNATNKRHAMITML